MNNTARKNNFIAKLPLIFMVVSGASFGCTFHWHDYGDTEIHKRITNKIGEHVSDEWCKKYNDKYELFIITDHFNDSSASLGVGSVGIRKIGSNSTPINRQSGYRYEQGNYVVGESYNLASQATIDALDDLMSALDSYIPK